LPNHPGRERGFFFASARHRFGEEETTRWPGPWTMKLSRERLKQLINRSPDIVIATEGNGEVIYYNDGASATLGYSLDEVLGTYAARLYPSLEEAKRVMAAMRGPKHGGPGILETFPTTLRAKDGGEIPVAITATLIYDEEGREDGTIGFAKDLRDILHKEQLAVLGEVAIGLAHEINNPLAVIVNQLSLLERDIGRLTGDADSSVEYERLDAIQREVTRISEIVDCLDQMVQQDSYETIDYVGSARMVNLHRPKEPVHADERLKGLRLLVVDDDPGICQTLKEILEAVGCRVETAGDGEEALDLLREGTSPRFDLVLTDVVMPKMDGYELYLAVQEMLPELPVMMMTAFLYDKDHIIKRSRIKGLKGAIFKKPVDPDRLCAVIAESITRP
jgi:PAS domain S-box-containing protein